METDRERNRTALQGISLHLDKALRLCHELDLSGLSPFEQMEWDNRMKACKDAIMFSRQSVQKLIQILE